MGLLSKLLGGGGPSKIETYKEKGAVLIDVRTPGEYKSGHVKGAKNYPVQNIQGKTKEIAKMNKPVIVYCASGARSGQAAAILKSAGIDCINGGGYGKVSSYY